MIQTKTFVGYTVLVSIIATILTAGVCDSLRLVIASTNTEQSSACPYRWAIIHTIACRKV